MDIEMRYVYEVYRENSFSKAAENKRAVLDNNGWDKRPSAVGSEKITCILAGEGV